MENQFHRVLHVVCIWIYTFNTVRSTEWTIRYLGNRPHSFMNETPLTVVREFGYTYLNGMIQQIKINGEEINFANPIDTENGGEVESYSLEKDEYLNFIELLYKYPKIINMKFYTNKRLFNGFSLSSEDSQELQDMIPHFDFVKIVAIGVTLFKVKGQEPGYLHNIRLLYLYDYQPSQFEAANVTCIVEYKPFDPSEKSGMIEYVNASDKMTESYTKVLKTMMQGRFFKDGVVNEFIAKVVENSFDEIPTIWPDWITSELESRLKDKPAKIFPIYNEYVGVKFVTGDLLRAPNGTYWVFPTSGTWHILIKYNDVQNLLGHYDLTGELYNKIPRLEKYKREKNGFVYYDNANN